MIARGLPILMIAALLMCPALCAQGVCVSDDACPDEPHSCCPRCAAAESERDVSGRESNLPAGPAGSPAQDCQCICGGAIRADAAELDTASLLARSFDFAIVPSDAVAARETRWNAREWISSVEDSLPSGRVICCLNSAFLC